MIDLPAMLLGAALVAIGVLAAAIADRIRGTSSARPAPERRVPARERVRAERAPEGTRGIGTRGIGTRGMGGDVVAALVTAGYDKQTAQIATEACAGSERGTIEAWTRAALRRCMKEASTRDSKEAR